jgi:hypothetical protein
LINKAEIKEVDKLLMSLESKFDSEFTTIHEQLNRKATIDDYQYYRKELQFKLDKQDLEGFRSEYIERVAMFDMKI